MADATQAKVFYKKWNGTGFEDAYVGADSGTSYTLIANCGDADWKTGYYVVGADFDDGTGTGTPDGIIDAKDAEYAKTNSLSTTFTISEGAIVSGDVKLILADGFTLKVTGDDFKAGIRVRNDSEFFTVYGQTNGTGKLNAHGGYCGAGIGGGNMNNGCNVTINGGIVIAEGDYGAAGIGGGDYGPAENITINGGTVTATGGMYAAGIGGGESNSGGNITITGGTVTATGGFSGAGIGGGDCCGGFNVTITGGTVTATGDAGGAGIGGGNGGESSDIYVNADLVVKADGNNPPTTEIAHTSDQDIAGNLSGKQYVTVEAPKLAPTVTFKDYQDGEFVDVTIGGKSGPKYTLITDSSSGVNWTAGYYVVGADYNDDGVINAADAALGTNTFMIVNSAEVSGDVKLILADGFTLTVTAATNSGGIIVCNSNSDFFTVYGQENGTGKLNASGGNGGAGIGGGGGDDGSNITINGGTVTATGGDSAAGIGGGYCCDGFNIKINGGTVTAIGGMDATGIGGGENGSGRQIYVSADLVVKAGNSNPPTKEISHTSDDDISGILNEKQYVTVEKLSGYKLETYGKWGTGAVGGGGVTFTVDSKEVTRAEENDVVTIAPIELPNYYCAGASSTDVTITDNQFTMPAKDVTVTATYYTLVTTRKVITSGEESLGENAAYKDISTTGDGGAVSVSVGASATGSNLMFVDNKTADSVNKGGAIYNKGTVTINNGATFTGNSAYNGGAIYNDKGTVTINDGATFTGNTAKGNGGAIYNNASGSTTATLTIHGGATFTGNTATNNGGSAIYNNTNSTLTIYDGATFSNNTAENGNGTLFSKGTVTINDGATFTGNTTNNEGGAIYTYDNSELTINGDATFTDNTTKKNGGAIYNSATLTIDGDATFSNNTVRENNGGAIYSKGTLTITGKATFNGNTADVKGGAIYNEAGTINFSGLMDLQTGTDSWVNLGFYMSAQETFATVNWDLTGGQEKYGSINNFQRYSNLTTKVGEIQKYLVTQTITVAAEQEVGEYVIATGDMTGYDTDATGKYSFTITDGTTPAETALTVGESVIYNELKYTLTVSDNGTPEDATDDNLVLTVAPSSYALNTQGLWGETPVADSGVTFTVGETPVTRAKEDDVVTIAPIEVAGYYYGGASSKEVTIIDNQFTMPASDVTVTANYYELVTTRKVITSGTESLGTNVAYKDISTTDNGGAVYVGEGASATGSNLMFVNNTAAKLDKKSKNGGAICNNGTVTINGDATFSGNTASKSGGAIYNDQGTLTIGGNATFSGNTASTYSGGAIYNDQGTLTIDGDATFTGNTASSSGGAIYNDRGTLTINGDAIFSGNTASQYGGAIYNLKATINFAGEITLATKSDILRNSGGSTDLVATANWDLSRGTKQYGSIRNFQRYENASSKYGCFVNQFITVAAEQEVGEYVIATGDMTGYDTDETGKYSFTITDGTTPAGTALTVGKSVVYNDLKYTLTISDNDTPEVATDDELVLTVAELPVCTLTSASNQTWGGVTFRVGETPVTDAKEGETVTVTAQDAEEGYVFVNFTSDEVVIVDNQFTMPAEAVTVTANYYKVAVANDTTNKYLNGTDTEIISGETTVMTYGGTNNESGAELEGSYSIVIANSEDPAHYGESFAAGDKVKSCNVSRDGSISLTIEGGTFDKRVAGGMYYTENETQTAGSALLADGDVNVTIEGGTFKGRVYGGCNAQNDDLGVYTTIDGSVNLTVDVQKTISFDNHLVAGSRGKGAITGDTTVTFTGEAGSGEDCLLKFADSSIVFGGSSGDFYKNGQEEAQTAVEGKRNLVFSSYTGDFDAQIMMFSTASFEKETDVNFTDEKLDLWAVDDWSFEAGSTASGLAKNDFTGDTLNFDLTNFDSSLPWTVLSGKDEAFTGFDKIDAVDFGGTAEVKYIENKGVWSDGTYQLALSSEEGKKSMILSLAFI